MSNFCLRQLQDLTDRGWRKIVYVGAAWAGKNRLRRWGVEYGEKLVLYGMPIVSVADGASLTLGKRVVLCSWSGYTALGVAHPVVLRAMLPGARIVIGDHVGISGASICSSTFVEIGSGTLLGANVIISDTDFHPVANLARRYANLSEAASAGVVIEENVFVGANVVVLKGVHIGRNSVVGAGSIVTDDIPADVVASGNPARVIKVLEPAGQGPRAQ